MWRKGGDVVCREVPLSWLPGATEFSWFFGERVEAPGGKQRSETYWDEPSCQSGMCADSSSWALVPVSTNVFVTRLYPHSSLLSGLCFGQHVSVLISGSLCAPFVC